MAKSKREVYALWKGCCLVRVCTTQEDGHWVLFDNGERALVPGSDLEFTFDLQ